MYRKQLIDGVYRLDEGALLDDCFHCLLAVGVMALVEHAYGTAIPRTRLPLIQYVLRYGLQTLLRIEQRDGDSGVCAVDPPTCGPSQTRSLRND